MEFLIGFVVTLIVLLLIRVSKGPRSKQPRPDVGEHISRREQDEEIITVVLPTINDDK